MNRSLAFSMLALAFVSVAPAMTSCSRQGEGQRCAATPDKLANSGTDSDCADGLQCTQGKLLQHQPQAPICCPIDGSFSVLDCTPKQPTTAGAGGGGGTSGSTATGSGGAGGKSSSSSSQATSSSSKASASASSSSSSSASGSAGGA